MIEINPFYKNVIVDNDWKNVSEQSDPEFWKLLTNDNGKEFNVDDQTDSDDDIEGNNKLKEREMKMSSLPFPTVMRNIDRPNISSSEIVNIAPGEDQIPVSFTSEPNLEAFAFPKEYSVGINHFNEDRDNPITPSKCVHTRLKCFDDRFASNSRYIFHALDWIERNTVASSIHFPERKQFQSDISVGQLMNKITVKRMISDAMIRFSPPLKTEELLSTSTICFWMFLLKLGSLGYALSF